MTDIQLDSSRVEPRLFAVSAALIAGCVLLAGCGTEETVGTAPPSKAVEVRTLRTGTPRSETLFAGVVEPYRRSDVSFDVSGVLDQVIDVGETARGPQLDGSGAMLRSANGDAVRAGTVLAELTETRFRQAFEAARLSLASTDRQIEALRVELEKVFPARLSNAEAAAAGATADVASAREAVTVAEAELELARTTVERDRTLIGPGAIAQSVLDQSESAFRTAGAGLTQAQAALEAARQSQRSAEASLAESQGNLLVRQADLASLRASRAELVNQVEQAQTDLDARVLRAPFQGRVTARYVERGGFVNAGTPVAQLTMETAVKVVITVSAEQERRIALGMQMPIYAGAQAGGPEARAYPGTVFEKASVADAGTRTFRIGLILPNPILGEGDAAGGQDAASVGDLFPVLNLPGTPAGDLYVNVACAFEREGGTFVLALSRESAASATPGSVQVPTAVPITFTDDWEQLDTATLRRIEPTRQLQSGDPLVVAPTVDDEAGVRIGSRQYAFRPGDVVRVGVDAALPTAGLWVPTTAIVPRTGDNLLFVVEDGAAREVAVDLVETSGSFRRVVAPNLGPGASVVVNGMQYLADGDAVAIRNAPDGVDR